MPRARSATMDPIFPRPMIPRVWPIELRADKSLLLPASFMHGLVGLRNIAGKGEHERKRVFRGGHGVGARGVHHQDSPGTCRLHIDIVNPGPCAADHLEPSGMVQQFLGHPGAAPNHHGIIFVKSRLDLFSAQLLMSIHRDALGRREKRQPTLIQSVTYKNLHALETINSKFETRDLGSQELSNLATHHSYPYLLAQIRLLDFGVPGQFLSRSLHHDLPGLQNIGAMSIFQGDAGILFDDQDGGPGFVEFFQHAKELLHKQRRKPHGRFVQQDEPNAAHEGPSHGQHLLFPAAQRVPTLMSAVGKARERANTRS